MLSSLLFAFLSTLFPNKLSPRPIVSLEKCILDWANLLISVSLHSSFSSLILISPHFGLQLPSVPPSVARLSGLMQVATQKIQRPPGWRRLFIATQFVYLICLTQHFVFWFTSKLGLVTIYDFLCWQWHLPFPFWNSDLWANRSASVCKGSLQFSGGCVLFGNGHLNEDALYKREGICLSSCLWKWVESGPHVFTHGQDSRASFMENWRPFSWRDAPKLLPIVLPLHTYLVFTKRQYAPIDTALFPPP